MQRVIQFVLPLSLVTWPVLVDAGVKGLILSIAVGICVLASRKRSASVKHAIWLTGMCALLVLPMLTLCLPAWRILPEWYVVSEREDFPVTETALVVNYPNQAPIELERLKLFTPAQTSLDVPEDEVLTQVGDENLTPTEAIELTRIDPTMTLDPVELTAIEPSTTPQYLITPRDTYPDAATQDAEPAPWLMWFFGVWLAGAVGMLLRLICGQWALTRLCRRAEQLANDSWCDRIDGLCSELEFKSSHKVTVWKLATRMIPMACGIFRSRVVLPSDIDSWDEERLRAVLLHELAHIKRRDCLTQWIAELARVLHWFNSLVWLAVGQMRAERERACDDLVLGRGLAATAYADQLVQMTAEYPKFRHQVPLAVAMARESGLENRIRRILDSQANRARLTKLGFVVLTVLIAGILLPLSMLDRRATATESGQDAAKTAPKQSQDAGDQASTKPKPRYEVSPQNNQPIELDGRIFVNAKLHNEGKDDVTVYWGDVALPETYRFDIQHNDTNQRLPTTRLPAWHVHSNPFANQRYFRTIKPGESISYQIFLGPSPGANAQQVYFRTPGKYTITPSFHAKVTTPIDYKTGKTIKTIQAWTGELKSKPFTIRVKGDASDLEEGVSLAGVVKTHDGKPAAGAIVQARHRIPGFGSIDGYYEMMLDQVFADKNGRFQFRRLPKDSSLFSLTGWLDGHPIVNSKVVNEGHAKVNDIEIALPKGVAIKGKVIDETGQPMANVRVSSKAYTDKDGLFSFVAPANKDEYYISLWYPGYISPSENISADDATSGKQTFTLKTESAAKITGRVRFVGGTPVPLAKLQFALTPLGEEPTPQNRRGTACTTETNGKFEIVLPEARDYSAVATLYEPLKNFQGQVWKLKIPKLSAESGPLELEFENRGQIDVQLSQTNKLPDTLQLRVRCSLESRHALKEQVIPVSQKTVSFANLTPGEYHIAVSVKSAAHLTWREQINVSADKPTEVTNVQMKSPEIHFGDVTAKIVAPDGKTPIANAQFWVDSSSGYGGVRTDEDGNLAIKIHPAGRLLLTPRNVAGVAPESLKAQVVGGKTTDLGTLKLQRIEDVYAWIEGTLKYDDGSSVIGATNHGLADGVSSMGTMMPRGFKGAGRIGQDGTFRVRLPAKRHYVAFDLSNAAGWHLQHPDVELPTYRQFRGDTPFERLEIWADPKPGETLKRDIVLKRSRKKRPLTVSWKIPKAEMVYVTATVENNNYRLTKTIPVSNEKSQVQFTYVPEGHCTVVLFATGAPYFGVKSVNASKAKAEVSFDASKSTSLAVRVLDENGKPLRGLGLSVSAHFGRHQSTVCRVYPLSHGTKRDGVPASLEEREDGTMIVRALAPDAYTVEVTNGQWKQQQTVSLRKAGAMALLEWVVDKDGKIINKAIKPKIEKLKQDLRDKNAAIRTRAFRYLSKAGESAAPATWDMFQLLSDQSWVTAYAQPIYGTRVCGYAENALIEIGKPAVPALIEGLAGDSWEQRKRSATVLRSTKDPPAIDALVSCLDDDDRRVRYGASAALGELGKAAKPAVLKVLTRGSTDARLAVAYAVPKIDDVELNKELLKGLNSDNLLMRKTFAYALQDGVQPELDRRFVLITAVSGNA